MQTEEIRNRITRLGPKRILEATYVEDHMVDRDDVMGVIEDILAVAYVLDWEERSGYSGRGMSGEGSEIAIVAPAHPDSYEGQALQALGMSVDSLGLSRVYYFKDGLPETLPGFNEDE